MGRGLSFISLRVRKGSLDGGLVFRLPMSEWLQPSAAASDQLPPSKPVRHQCHAPPLPAWRLLPWAGARGVHTILWLPAVLDASCALYYSCCILMLCDVTEGDRLPVGLRGFGRRPSQCDQWEADISVRSAVPPPPEPAGTASPHRHPGELQVFWYRWCCSLFISNWVLKYPFSKHWVMILLLLVLSLGF